MTFGTREDENRSGQIGGNPNLVTPTVTTPTSEGGPKPPPNAPQAANSSVLLAGLMGLRQNKNPALSAAFRTGTTGALGRRPSLSKRTAIGGA